MAADNRAAQALRQILGKKTQKEVASETGLSQPHVSRLASGEKVLSDRRDGMVFRDLYGIELDWWDQPPVSEPTEAA